MPDDEMPICENCGNDDATMVIALCEDCAEGLPGAQ